MGYRKFKADHLFTGTEILTSNHVLITKENGEVEAITEAEKAGQDIEIFSGILSPGFINAHCHLELSHMKGLIPENTGLVNFVLRVVNDRNSFTEEEIAHAIAKAEDEMLQNGVVAVGDICNNATTFPQKQRQRLQYYNFIEASGWLPAVAQPRFERALHLYKMFTHHSPLTNHNAIVPHAPYSVSEDLWKHITPYFANRTVSIHNQEAPFEDEFFLQGTGDFLRMFQMMNIETSFHKPSNKSSLQTYFNKLSKAASVILVHNTFIKQEDIEFINDQLRTYNFYPTTYFCLCPNANLYIENTLQPVDLFIKNNCNIVLGTDSLASNRSLNIWDEIQTLQKYSPHISLEQMLQWATLNGAKALQMNDKLGSFEKGKKPGVVCLNRDSNDFTISGIKRII